MVRIVTAPDSGIDPGCQSNGRLLCQWNIGVTKIKIELADEFRAG